MCNQKILELQLYYIIMQLFSDLQSNVTSNMFFSNLCYNI